MNRRACKINLTTREQMFSFSRNFLVQESNQEKGTNAGRVRVGREFEPPWMFVSSLKQELCAVVRMMEGEMVEALSREQPEQPAVNAEYLSSGRDLLIEEYLGFVESVAKRLIQSMRLPVALYEEFVAAGYLGLVEAAERFVPESGPGFKRYAFLRIRGAIIDGLRRSSDISGPAYRFSRALQAAHEVREMTAAEHDDHRESAPVKLARILDAAAQGAIAFRLSMEDADRAFATLSDAHTPEIGLLESEETKKLRQVVATLPLIERKIIEEYYFNGRSFTEIAELHGEGISKSWVSRLHVRALARIREGLLKVYGVSVPRIRRRRRARRVSRSDSA